MSVFVGGDIVEITFNHPTLGSGVLFPKASEDNTYDLGGIRGNDDKNMVTSGGVNIRQLNNTGWRANATCANDMNVGLDIEKINALAADPTEADWTLTHVNGSVYGGKGAPLGDVVNNVNKATFSLILGGGGKLTKIA